MLKNNGNKNEDSYGSVGIRTSILEISFATNQMSLVSSQSVCELNV